jgi:hypothetical protein
MDPIPGASVQRSNSLKPHSHRIRPPTDLSTAPPAPPPPQGYAPRHPESDQLQTEYNKPIDRIRAEEVDSNVNGGPGGQPRTRTGSDPRQVGDWQLGKTIGAGSMGKVKTATNVYTGEKVGLARGIAWFEKMAKGGLTADVDLERLVARSCFVCHSARSRSFLGGRHRPHLNLPMENP